VLAGARKHHAPVSLLVLVAAASAAGFALILLLGRGQRISPAAEGGAPQEPAEDLAWVRALGPEGFERLLRSLFAEMGFAPQPGTRGRGSVEFLAVDPRPIQGGRLYVHGAWAPPGAGVGGDEVRTLLDAARGEAAGKAVLVTLGHFSADAREAARDNPVDLVDGAELAALVRKRLPQSWATRTLAH